ncbi:MAG: hypothetical protein QXK80_02745 [Candidatus Pacearchaeota archaeon]
MKMQKIDKQKEIDWDKYTKEDKKFLINLSIQNRNYLTTVNNLLLAMTIGMSGFATALYGLFISLGLISQNIANTLLVILLLGMWTHWYIVHIKYVKFIKTLNEQYQKIHKTIHPELFKGGYYY